MKRSYSMFLLVLGCGIVLLLRLYVSLTRYIDPDEFAHLHWSYLISQGTIPYRQFFTNFLPFYFWILAPIMSIHSVTTVYVVRLIQLGFIVAIALLSGYVAHRITYRKSAATLTALLFLITPMTFDKTIEIRPDTLMTLFYIASISLLLKKGLLSQSRIYMAGLCLGASVATMFKIAYGIPSVILLVLFFSPKRKALPNLILFFLGFALPLLFIAVFLFSTQSWQLALENIVHGSLLIKQGEGAFSPFKSWSPYPLVYTNTHEVSIPWLLNCALWICSFLGIVTTFKKSPLVASSFICLLGLGIASLFLFPTPYLQYFIPLSAFVSILTAIFLDGMLQHIDVRSRHIALFGYFTCVALCVTSVWIQFSLRVGNGNDNAEQIQVIKDILTISRAGEPVYDMVGSYVFRPDGYYICCNIYSNFADKLHIPFPSLRDSLQSSKTKFIILDRAGKSLWLPEANDLLYIKTHFLPSNKKKIYTFGMQFNCNDSACMQFGIDNQQLPIPPNNKLSLISSDMYIITSRPNDNLVSIDGKPSSSSPMYLAEGIHTFSVAPQTTYFSIQLSR